MTDWKNRLNIGDLHAKYDEGTITPSELGKAVSERIDELKKRLPDWYEKEGLTDQLEEIADGFQSIEDIEDYDSVLSELYDWGDTVLPHSANVGFSQIPKVCWIDTSKVAVK